ncbi:hypothetical protein [Micromonospora sp. NPDC049107]|uniref:hypothetical protein n=1 Tax=unclassified Micromonospora TaxID=2617518 RepID=UPI0033FBF8BC
MIEHIGYAIQEPRYRWSRLPGRRCVGIGWARGETEAVGVADEAEIHRVVLIRDLVTGAVGVVVASFATAVVFPPEDPVGRVLVMAVACGLLATALSDWRASLAVAVVAVGVFVGVLADGAPPAPSPWGFTPIFVVAVVLGAGNRYLRVLRRRDEGHRRS